ncbi:mechanosensitive ion channel [Aeoliella sp. ICT_H6.2]|uniref:Mechanosensitive ion channel n=1 Tax=Aeoliella straminimaris TaxID=2954799 RepID=A0A9X2FIC5_9BACT|nr:mechanosensitive ion channel domain-containing protein [Aeoliella straminimaris]MCO6047689.1 mechanosensitive ion channel [Aeoliella straminimaris]
MYRTAHSAVGLLLATFVVSQSSAPVCRAEALPAAGPLLKAADQDVTPPEQTSIADQREEVAERIRVAQRSLPESADNNQQTPEPTSREVELLKQKDLVLQQREASQQLKDELVEDRAEVQEQLDDLRQNGPQAEKPYSFLYLESLNDSLAAERDRLESRTAATNASRESLERAKSAAEDAAKERRRAAERAKTNDDPAEAGELALELKYETLESELAAAVVELRRIELENEKYVEETKKLESQLLEETIAQVEQDVTFSWSDFQKQLVALDELKKDINNELEENEAGRRYLDEQWSNARARMDQANDPSGALRAEVEARDRARTLRTEEKQMLADQLQWLAPMRQTWNRRYQIATGEFTTNELTDWEDTAESLVDELSYERRLIDARIDGLRSNLAAVDRRMKDTSEDDTQVRRWLRDQQRTLRAGIEFYNDSYIRLDAATRLHEKLLLEIERRADHFSFSQWMSVYGQRAANIWSYELASTKDDNPITVGKVVMGALLLVLGFAISKRLSRFFGRRILPRLGVQEGAAHALGSLTFYALVCCATLLALRLVNVPLTLFTFLGGALAIGVGFGSQRLVNNFLSGLILLTERPVRVGDMIQLGEVIGIVEAIGTRSTRIRTETNLEIIVPNSALVENNVSNWTLSDPTIRTLVKVGVQYGSPTDQVVEIMESVAEQHIRVLDAPESFAWFTGFGDNALEFELHFFLVFRNLTEQKRIQSELRLEIERRFRQANIVVAYPQRDVHLDTSQPLQIHFSGDTPNDRGKVA